MKTIQYPENKEELRNLLIHEDIVLELDFRGLSHRLDTEGEFSSDKLSNNDVLRMIEDVLRDSGIVLVVKRS